MFRSRSYRSRALLIGLLLGTGAVANPARSQDGQLQTAGQWAWKTITVDSGVRFAYVFYSRADNRNNGVVLRLDNENVQPVRYRFTAVFRSGDTEVERQVEGRIDARSIVTGDAFGLYFVPFTDGRQVAEIGLRGIRISPDEGGD